MYNKSILYFQILSTIFTPQIGLFKDPISGKYGLK